MLLNGQRWLVLGRLYHTTTSKCAPSVVDKASLSKLRKKTGFPLINVRKALEKFHGDLKKSERWLREEAQKEGWAKATKLQDRPMSQGLIGVTIQKKMAAMVEVNCETDFVARNEKFRDMVAKVSATCLRDAQSHKNNKLLMTRKDVEELSYHNSSIADIVALVIGDVGENMAVRRGASLRADDDGHLGYYIHTSSHHKGKDGHCILGSYGALVSFNITEPPPKPPRPAATEPEGSEPAEVEEELPLDIARVGQQLCQHIVGMNPTSLGIPDAKEEEKDINTQLLHQEYLIETGMTVHEYLVENGIEIKDFVRFQCGEELPSDDDS